MWETVWFHTCVKNGSAMVFQNKLTWCLISCAHTHAQTWCHNVARAPTLSSIMLWSSSRGALRSSSILHMQLDSWEILQTKWANSIGCATSANIISLAVVVFHALDLRLFPYYKKSRDGWGRNLSGCSVPAFTTSLGHQRHARTHIHTRAQSGRFFTQQNNSLDKQCFFLSEFSAFVWMWGS